MENLHSICLARNSSRKTAIICTDTGYALSYAELASAARLLAEQLQVTLVRQKGPVLLYLPASLEWAVAFFAVLTAGSIAAPVDKYMKNNTFQYLVKFINPVLIITNEAMFRKIPQEILDTHTVLVINVKDEFDNKQMKIQVYNCGALSRQEIFCAYHPDRLTTREAVPLPAVLPETDAVFITTSGTTGMPKVVRLSHKRVLENIRMHLESLDLSIPVTGIQTLDLNYSYGLIASFLAMLYNQGTVILAPRLEMDLLCNILLKYGVSYWTGTPSLFHFIYNSVKPEHLNALRSLRKITIGGDSCSPFLRREIACIFNRSDIYITYGMTEAGPRIATLPPQYLLDKISSVGLPLNGLEIKIVKVRDVPEQCETGQYGQIAVRSPALMLGYYKDTVLTENIIQDNWCLTGDLGSVDNDGFLYVMGRIDNQFKFRSRRINPREIEDCLLLHPGVIAAFVSKAGAEEDSYLQAKIITGNSAVSPQEIKRHCMKHLPMYLVPAVFDITTKQAYYFKGKQVLIQR